MSTRAVLTAYGGWMAALGVAYLLLPSGQPIIATTLGASCAAAIIGGVWCFKPPRPGPWLMLSLAAALAGSARGMPVLQSPAASAPLTYLNHIANAMMVLCLVGGLLWFTHRAGRRDWIAVIDGVIAVLGIGLLFWIFIIAPLGTAERLWHPGQFVVLYPLGDVVLLAATLSFITTVRRSVSTTLVTAAITSLIVNNTAYWIVTNRGSWDWGSPADLGWIISLTLGGLSALHPSMVQASAPQAVRPREVGTARLVLLTMTALIPPVVIVADSVRGTTQFRRSLIAVCVAVLVLARLAGVAVQLRRQFAREHDLRKITANLVAATDVEEVIQTLDSAARRLLPAGTRCQLVLAAADPASIPRPGGLGQADPNGEDGGPIQTATLPAEMTTGLDLDCPTLAFPLTNADPKTDGEVSVLLVNASRDALDIVRTPLGTLAGSASLALERIRLSHEVIRDASEEYFRALVHNAADVILVIDDDDRIRYASPSAAAIFGERSLPGLALPDLISDPDEASRLLTVTRSAGEPGDAAGWTHAADWTVTDGRGRTTQVEVACRDLRTEASVRGLVLTLRDVTERRRLERELTRRAFHDALTGLPNRVLFGYRVREAVVQSARAGAVTGVLLIDLDEFKLINDALGHDAGDAYLISVGQRLIDGLGTRGIAARLGGDEFGALVASAPDVAAVERIAADIVSILGQPVRLNGQFVACGASVGVATTSQAHVESQELMHRADLSLYAAKEGGKGRWRHYEPAMHNAIVRRLELRSSLENALNEDEFRVTYQPIVALEGGRVVGYEALLRWQHPTRGLLTPAEFIDVAEESGLIVPIGEWVLSSALAAAASWRQAAPDGPPYVSVNVSARQFRTPRFIQRVRALLAKTGLAPRLLLLEITETLLLHDDDQIWAELHDLRRMGVRIAIDDFGTGYSALSYLRQVPLDVVKIDRLFISTIVSSPKQRAVFEGVVRIADTLGLQVVAEGIETEAELALVVRAGCAYGQGFIFARPMPGTEVARTLARRATAPAPTRR